jgi:hypothetical protein
LYLDVWYLTSGIRAMFSILLSVSCAVNVFIDIWYLTSGIGAHPSATKRAIFFFIFAVFFQEDKRGSQHSEKILYIFGWNLQNL